MTFIYYVCLEYTYILKTIPLQTSRELTRLTYFIVTQATSNYSPCDEEYVLYNKFMDCFDTDLAMIFITDLS